MQSKVNVLMTGAGAPGAPGIIQCLSKADWINLVVGDAKEDAIGKWLHPHFVPLLPANDPIYVSHLLEACNKHSIQIILPLVTKELFPLSAAKKDFEKRGIKILVSEPEALNIANNKLATYQYLEKHNIAVPNFFAVSNVEEFEFSARALGFPKKEFCFKPAIANGSRGFRIVSDKTNASDMLFNHKPTHSFITYKEAVKVLSARNFPQLVVSDFLPGEEYSVDCLASNGKAKLVLPRLRIKMVNGISTAGRFIKDRDIIDYCTKIIGAIGLHGNIGIQVKRAEDGTPLLLEINPRVQGSIVTTLGAGINLPLLAIEQELGMAIDLDNLEVQWGKGFLRYWMEVYL